MINVEKISFGAALCAYSEEWDELLLRSSYPSIYSSFDFVYTSCVHGRQEETLFFLFFREAATGELLAIFPLSLWAEERFGIKLRVLAHAVTTSFTEVDKPYPILKEGCETRCWERFKVYFQREYTGWDVIDFDTFWADSYLAREIKPLFPFPRYCAKVIPGPESPLVNLEGDWEAFWNQYRLVRRKTLRIEEEIGERLSYLLTNDLDDIERCLRQHVETERLGWKAGKGVSEEGTERLYFDLLPKLAARKQVYFSIMYDGEVVMSSAFSYVFLDKVYFVQITYNPAYSAMSPGIVNLAHMIQYFMGKGYGVGDFLCGAAHYAYPWAARIEKTVDVTIHRMGMKGWMLAMRYYCLRHQVLRRRAGIRRRLARRHLSGRAAAVK
jgi:CelD/BcsL family acetyltransferase involved in cellulose biosynthesis